MDWQAVRSKLDQYYWYILIAVAGLWLVSQWGFLSSNQPEAEVYSLSQATASADVQLQSDLIWVDIAGAVEQPGVYSLTTGARVEQVLQLAGGLKEQADLGWVEQELNRAAILQDGSKLYIPAQGEAGKVIGSQTGLDKVSINTASQAELEALWGIGEVTAKRIIDHRPYNKVEDLIDQNLITPQAWQENKDKFSL